jgi:hypothetical protein
MALSTTGRCRSSKALPASATASQYISSAAWQLSDRDWPSRLSARRCISRHRWPSDRATASQMSFSLATSAPRCTAMTFGTRVAIKFRCTAARTGLPPRRPAASLCTSSAHPVSSAATHRAASPASLAHENDRASACSAAAVPCSSRMSTLVRHAGISRIAD